MCTLRARFRIASTRAVVGTCWCAMLLVVAAPATADDTLRTLAEVERTQRIAEHQQRFLPGRISDARIAEWAVLFELDDIQADALTALAEEYARRFAILDKARHRTIAAQWPAAFEYDRAQRAVREVYNPQLVDLYREHIRLLEGVIETDRYLFNSLRSQLRLEQHLALRHEQEARLRNLLQLPTHLIEANLDLPALIEAIPLTEPQQQRITPILLRHLEARIGRLEELIITRRRHVDLARAELLLSLGPHWRHILDADAIATVDNTLHEMDDIDRFVAIYLAATNWRTLNDVATQLPDDVRHAVVDTYLRTIWPDLFQEPDELFRFADAMLEWLPAPDDDPLVHTTIVVQREQLEHDLRTMLERAIQERFGTFPDGPPTLHPLDMTVAATELLEHFPLPDRVTANIGWHQFRIDRRDRLMAYSAQLRTLYQLHRPEQLEPIETLRDMQDARQDADRYRIRALRAFLDVWRARQDAQ